MCVVVLLLLTNWPCKAEGARCASVVVGNANICLANVKHAEWGNLNTYLSRLGPQSTALFCHRPELNCWQWSRSIGHCTADTVNWDSIETEYCWATHKHTHTHRAQGLIRDLGTMSSTDWLPHQSDRVIVLAGVLARQRLIHFRTPIQLAFSPSPSLPFCPFDLLIYRNLTA